MLQPGTAVYTSGREQIGTVEQVLFVQEEDVFDGIVVQTGDGARFVDASDVDGIFERCVITSLSLEQAKALPPPETRAAGLRRRPGAGHRHVSARPFPPLVREGALVEALAAPEERGGAAHVGDERDDRAQLERSWSSGGAFRSTGRGSAPAPLRLSAGRLPALTLAPCQESTR